MRFSINKRNIIRHIICGYRKEVYVIFIALLSVGSMFSQITYSSNPAVGTYTPCPNLDYGTCASYYIHGNGVLKVRLQQITSSNFYFRVSKCSGTFSTPGTGWIKQDGVCGVVVGGPTNYSSGISTFDVQVPIPSDFVSGTRDFYAMIHLDNDYMEGYYAGPVSITATCPDDNYEPNDSRPSAYIGLFPTLDCDNMASGPHYATIHEDGDVDYYRVDYTHPGEVFVDLTNLPANYALELVSSSGSNLDASDNSGTSSEHVDQVFNGSNGYFYVKVYGNNNNNSSCDDYTLNLNWVVELINSPTLTNPSDNNNYNSPPSSITYQWNKNNISGAATYEIRLRDVTTNDVILNYLNVGDNSFYTHNYSYEAGHDYRWTVRAEDDCNNHAESPAFDFDIDAEPQINITSPVGAYAYPLYDTDGNLNEISITWTSSNVPGDVGIELHDENENYILQIDGSAPNTGSYTWQIPNANDVPSGSYMIYMYPTGTNGYPFYGGEFKIIDHPDLTSPSDGYIYSTTPNSITYSWVRNNPAGHADYEIRLRDVTTNMVLLSWVNTDTETSHVHTYSYEDGHEYAWVVRAKAGTNNATIESPAFDFTVNSAGPQINFLTPDADYAYPKYDVNGILEHLDVTWTSNNVSGNVNMELRTSGGDPVADMGSNLPNSNTVTNSHSWQLTSDIGGGDYKILIYPTGTTGQGSYSSIFKIINHPILQNPTDNYNYSSPPVSITYGWDRNNPIGHADYEIRLKDVTTNIVLMNWESTDTEVSHLHNYSYEDGHEYAWVVRAKAGTNNATTESPAFDFEIGGSGPCTDPVINLASPYCDGSTYTIDMDFAGTTGHTYDIYASSPSGTYSGPSGVPSGTYEITGILSNADVTLFVEDVLDSSCNDTEAIIGPDCGASCPDTYETNNADSTASTGIFSDLGTSGYSHSISDANIHQNGDVDYFKVNYTAAGTVNVDLTNLPANYELELWNETVNLTYSINPGTIDESVSWAFTGAGYFYIKIYGNGGTNSSCSNYILGLSWTPGASGLCDYFSDLPNPGDDNGEAFDAASCLCGLGYVVPQDYNNDGTSDEVNPDVPIYRADLAKVVYQAMYQGDPISPTKYYPVPFADLQDQYTSDYYDYAIALSYLEYDDNITPFDRDFVNFYPYDNIQKRYALKVVLEAYNIEPDSSDVGPIQGLTHGSDAYPYVHKALDMGLIGNSGSATQDVLRRDFFIIMHRLLSYSGSNPPASCSDCESTCLDPNPQISDYAVPPNAIPQNMSRSFSLNEGFFQHSPMAKFLIPGRNIPLEFSLSYSSYLAELPDAFTPNTSLGRGWTHTYNAYAVEIEGWQAEGITHPDHLFVFWPSGSIDFYDENDDAMDPGNYDEILTHTSTSLIIKNKKQFEYTFTKTGVSSDDPFMLTKIEDRNGNNISITLQNGVNSPKRIQRVTGTTGKVLYFNYTGGSDKISSILDGSGGRTIQFNVDNEDNLLWCQDPNGSFEYYSYGTNPSMHLLVEVTKPKGNKLLNEYNVQTNRYKKTQIKNGGTVLYELNVNVAHNYNTSNPYISSVISDVNTTTTNLFNTNGTIDELTVTNDGTVINTNLDYMDNINEYLPTTIQYGSASQNFDVDYSYDANGNVERVTLPNSSYHEFSYNSNNDPATYRNPRTHTTNYTYDGISNLTRITDPMTFQTNYSVNSFGQVSSMTNPEGITSTYSYDAHGNLTATSLPLNITTNASYDNVNRLTSLTNPKSQVTQFQYDNHDLITRKTRVSSGGNVITRYFYDANNNLTEVKNALNNSTTYTYDNGDFIRTSKLGNDTKTFNYFKDGKLKQYIKPDGTILNQTYDDEDRIENDGYAAYTYDDEGNITQITANGQSIDFTYDILNRAKTIADFYGHFVTYSYDNNGNVTQIKYPGNYDVNYIFDANNRMTSVMWDGNSKTVDYSYFDDGRLDRVDFDNNSYCTYKYDAAGRMIELEHKKSNDSIINSYTFVLDKLGNHLQENKLEPYGIPPLSALNLTNTYNNENELMQSGSTNYTFDANGNQTSENAVSTTWNVVDLATSIGSNTYVYDGMKLRRKTTIGGISKKYVWDIRGNGNIIVETDNANNILSYFIHGVGLVAKVDVAGGNNSFYYHDDYRGSIIAMTDQNENVVNKYNYDPFGLVVEESENTSNPFKYVGRYGVMSDDTDLHYMRARYMDSRSGRFMSEDPVWHENLYPYSDNNPIVLIDYSGRTTYSLTLEVDAFLGFGGGLDIGLTYDDEKKDVSINIGGEGGVGVYAGMGPTITVGEGSTETGIYFNNQSCMAMLVEGCIVSDVSMDDVDFSPSIGVGAVVGAKSMFSAGIEISARDTYDSFADLIEPITRNNGRDFVQDFDSYIKNRR